MPNEVNNLKEALQILSKSSPQAVEVERDASDQDIYKQYLYIETDIEKDFAKRLEFLQPDEIIFLCGSSGDGKSAILTRYNKQYSGRIHFHLDATHSLDPYDNAISELDKLFTEVKEKRRPLIVGINVGMMGNYSEGGNKVHDEIKASMKAHILAKPSPSRKHYYLDFERYPKFEFKNHNAYSKFAEAFLNKLTQQKDNPFISLLERAEQEGQNSVLCSNFRLLSKPVVQNVIIDALMRARLINDQFMTARGMLDFIHQLLTGPSYLQDNLFASADNELSKSIAGFDPAMLRTKQIDQFILEFKLDLTDRAFQEFDKAIQDIGINDISEPEPFLRLFYLFKDVDFSNNFHHRFKEDFSSSLLEQFARVWKTHESYCEESTKDQKIALQSFYNDVLLNGLHRYMNRKSPELRDGHYFIEEYNKVKIVAALKIRGDLRLVALDKSRHVATFNAYLKVGSDSLSKLIVSINLYNLLMKLKEGYRPNKHDKSTVLILDELVSKIIEIANKQNTLLFYDETGRYELENDDDDLHVIEK